MCHAGLIGCTDILDGVTSVHTGATHAPVQRSYRTFNIDEAGLAEGLVAMGINLPRVRRVFQYLYGHHQSNVDDMAELYVNNVREPTRIKQALRSDTQLVQLLIKSLDEEWTSKDEQKAIDWLNAL